MTDDIERIDNRRTDESEDAEGQHLFGDRDETDDAEGHRLAVNRDETDDAEGHELAR